MKKINSYFKIKERAVVKKANINKAIIKKHNREKKRSFLYKNS